MKRIYQANKYANEFVLNFLNLTYLRGKESFPFTKYHPMLKLLKSRGVQQNHIMIDLHVLKWFNAL